MTLTRIYGRSSTDMQALSPERQSTLCCFYYQHTPGLPRLMSQMYLDEAVSGSIAWANRPAGHQLLLDLQPLDHLIVDEYQRIGRDLPDLIISIRLLVKRRVVVHILNLLILSLIDPNDPMFEMMLSQIAGLSQFERKTVSVRTKRGKAARQMQGYSAGFAPPPGFKYLPNPAFDADKWRADRNYKVARNLQVIDQDDQDFFDEAWKLYASGAKVKAIARRLAKKKGVERWPYFRLWRSLRKRKLDLEAERFRQERMKVGQKQ